MFASALLINWQVGQSDVQGSLQLSRKNILFETFPETIQILRMEQTADQIKSRIAALESFWVGSNAERKVASMTARLLDIPYHTRSDDRGGFYIYYLPVIKKSKKAMV